MIHTILFLITLVAVFFYGMFATLEKTEPRLNVVGVEVVKVEPKKEAPVVAVAPEAPTKVEEAAVIDIEHGKKIFMSTCIKCHNKDPNLKGPIGPELTDAPLEVMIAKVRTGRYPEVLPAGFVPKRKTKAMTKFPQFEKDVPSIHAWIQSVKTK